MQLGHTNIQTPSRGAARDTLNSLGPNPFEALPALVPSTDSDSSDSEGELEEVDGVKTRTKKEKEPVVHWHNDSYRASRSFHPWC